MLTASAGGQTFTLGGTLSSDGTMMSGAYTATAGTAPDGSACGSGTSQTGALAWSATLVPPLTGAFTGNLHSSDMFFSGLTNQDFPVTGSFVQGPNIGASNATISGTLSFIDPKTQLSDYPCISSGTVAVNGQISGNTVVLQLINVDGSSAGQIGTPASQLANVPGAQPVTFDSTTNGNVLHSAGVGYVVNTKACRSSDSGNNEDGGYICLAMNNSTACSQPISLSPAFLTFAPQLLGSSNPSTQKITLTNTQATGSAPLTGLSLMWIESDGGSDAGQTDFTTIPNFTEQDNCAVPPGSTFSLNPGQSCTVTVAFAPQASCTWLPNNGGVAPASCPLNLSAMLTIGNVPSVDSDQNFSVPVTGGGISFLQPSVPELDFGAEGFGETSLPQVLSFTNFGTTPVQVLPKAACSNVSLNQAHALPHPLVESSPVAGLQSIYELAPDTPNSTIDYSCDFDPGSQLPNFQISADTCSGALLEPQATCSLQVAFVPQSTATYIPSGGLDYFLELNTVQCTDPVNSPPSPSNPCELDGGRLPVELTANITSPLRMSPGAGLDFGAVAVGKSSATQTITLENDGTIPSPQTVNFLGKIVVSGAYTETDDCPSTLVPGASCTLTAKFKPSAAGHNNGKLTINFNTSANSTAETQLIYLRGTGQ